MYGGFAYGGAPYGGDGEAAGQVTGTLAAVLPALSAALTGEVTATVGGTLAATLGALTAALDGEVQEKFTGTFLTIGGTAYPFLSVQRRNAGLEHLRRAQNGDVRASVHGDDVRARVWACEAGILTDLEWEALEAVCTAPGTVDVGGDEVGSPSVACYPLPRATSHGHQPDQVRMGVDFLEALG